MNENMRRTIWEQTEKAVKYLHKKGCMTLCHWYPSAEEPQYLFYQVSDADEKAKAHISKTYPLAKVVFVDRAIIVYGQLKRDIAFANYRMSL